MINATLIYDGKQIPLNLANYPSLELIYKCLHDKLPATFDIRTHVIQLFDPIIGEYFDLNDDGLKSWLCLPVKDKQHMRLQIIRVQHNEPTRTSQSTFDAFQKIQHNIDILFRAIESRFERMKLFFVKLDRCLS
jgi:uncharacterized UPF0160 family protein